MTKFFRRIFSFRKIIFLFFLLLYSIIQAIILYLFLVSHVDLRLRRATDRISEDIVLKDGAWDISAYNADSNISDEQSVYILTSEGFIVERSGAIHGLLDLSRYTLIANYSVPTTVTMVTNEKWRVFSEPLLAENKPVGIILVANYSPEENNVLQIDKEIQDIANQIKSNIVINNDFIDVSRIDIRKIPFDTSFQIVNRFNKVLLQSNNNNSVSRSPSFIDRSYIENQLKGSRRKQVEDSITHKKYLTLTKPVLDEKGLVAGVVVVGESIEYIYATLLFYSIVIFFINLLLVIFFKPAIRLYEWIFYRNHKVRYVEKSLPNAIIFMKKACKLSINEETIDIPYASFQYYFCEGLFSKPKKRWEADELLEVFGEDFGAEKWRKVYDTMVALNRKTSVVVDKLFIVKDKRYFINPKLASIVGYVNS